MQGDIAEALNIITDHPDRMFVLTISGGSMHPTFVRGDKLYLHKPTKPIEVGDVVLVREDTGRYLIHRVVIAVPEIKTKGDALTELDGRIAEVIAIVASSRKTFTSRLRRIKLKGHGILRAVFKMDL